VGERGTGKPPLAVAPLASAPREITKWDIFYYVYGLLHHPGYRTKFADNLKRELPRIPFAPNPPGPPSRSGKGGEEVSPRGESSDSSSSPPRFGEGSGEGFWLFADAGRELARLHLDYEKLEPWPLELMETPDVPLSYRIEDKMRLAKDRQSLVVNPSLTLRALPAECFEYRLGNRSALEWVIDQYQVKEDKRSGIRSDPNRADDPEYIVRLVGQVVRVSVETVRIVKGLPKEFAP
jgi:predicted helicase